MSDQLGPLDRFFKEWDVIRGAWRSFIAACAIIALAIWATAYGHYNGTITEKEATIERLKFSLEQSEKDNGKLIRQLSDVKVNRAEGNMLLRKRALDLAQELTVFANQWDIGTLTSEQLHRMDEAYGVRFHLRVDQLVSDLEQVGVSTKELVRKLSNGFTAGAIREDAEEIKRLVAKLAD